MKAILELGGPRGYGRVEHEADEVAGLLDDAGEPPADGGAADLHVRGGVQPEDGGGRLEAHRVARLAGVVLAGGIHGEVERAVERHDGGREAEGGRLGIGRRL
ncbi:MAG: hypothetical protein QM704_02000 [Anaeromyxobacteraceae bacterium]